MKVPNEGVWAMDLANPISSVIPGSYGDVLAVLARTDAPLSGRRVASLTRGQASRRRVDAVLAELARTGVALVQEVPPAKLYRLNREHVAAAGIVELASLRDTLLSRIRAELASWDLPPQAAWMFGSAARGDAGTDSDIDLVLLMPQLRTDEDETAWAGQVDGLRERVLAWSGNELDVLALSADELRDLHDRGERLIDELRADALVLAGTGVKAVLRHKAVPA
ncbi:MAG: nucleotidyltransferase domain-containing protein [Candidatus Nanopelagicales bacterium]